MDLICRLCCTYYHSPKMENLFDDKNQHLLDKLKYCACFTFRIDVNDGLPPYICYRCTKLLLAAYQFKMICESAEANFWALSKLNGTDTMQMEEECQIEVVDCGRDRTLKGLDMESDAKKTTIANDNRESKMFSTDEREEKDTNKFGFVIHQTNANRTNQLTIPLRIEKRKILTKATELTTCDICGESFRRKRELKLHMKIAHHLEQEAVREKSWICESCGRSFRSEFALKYHINGAHVDTVEKNYSCDLCDFKCRQARYLVSHALTHTGAKPHRCDECGQAFGVQGSLNRHKREVHRRERPYKCTICDRYFITKVGLREHGNVHSDLALECPQCPSTYRYKKNLVRHLKQCHRSVTNSSQPLLTIG